MELTLSSPGTQYAQQSYKVSDSFPFKWINKKWKEGFYVTAMATAGSRWAVVMSRNSGFSAQVRWRAQKAGLCFESSTIQEKTYRHALILLTLKNIASRKTYAENSIVKLGSYF
jgi:hypothetical protein